jgi:hypothetical protein
MQDVAKLSR